MNQLSQSEQWIHQFDAMAAVIARATAEESIREIARKSSDCFWSENHMITPETSARLNGLYDISNIALARLALDDSSLLDTLVKYAISREVGAETFLRNVELNGLREVIANAEFCLEKGALKEGLREVVGSAAIACIRSASNKAVVSTLLKKVVHKVRSCGAASGEVLEDVTKAMGGLGVAADSILFLVVDPVTASHLALKTTSSGVLAFPNVTLKGGGIGQVVKVIVLDPTDFPAHEGGSRTAIVIDAAGMLIDPGKVGLARRVEKANGKANKPKVDLDALRTFGLDQHRPSVAVIEEVRW